MKLLAIDPGKHCVGYAYFEGKNLVEGGVFRFKHISELTVYFSKAWSEDRVVVEVPQVYVARNTDPNDLIEVALAAGVCLGLNGRSQAVRPYEWKGSIAKEVHHKRILAALGEPTAAIFNKVQASIRHNAIDAFALGMWAQGVRF